MYEDINKPTPKQVLSPKSRAEGTVMLFTPLCAVSVLWLQIQLAHYCVAGMKV